MPDFDLRCPQCNWLTVCGPAQMADWLRRYRLVKNISDGETELLVELFRTSTDRFACPQCGHAGLIASPSEPLDDKAWGESRKCESCGTPIPPARLEIFPDTRLCVACQNRDERGELTGPAEYCPHCGTVMVLKRAGGAGITRYVMTCPACRRVL
jgi:transcription elongation factor Elf1